MAAPCTSLKRQPGSPARAKGLQAPRREPGLGEAAVDGSVRVMSRRGVDLDAGVDEHQVALTHLAVVVDPVQGSPAWLPEAAMVLVSPAAAPFSGDRSECALDDALAATVGPRRGQDADDVLEAGLVTSTARIISSSSKASLVRRISERRSSKRFVVLAGFLAGGQPSPGCAPR